MPKKLNKSPYQCVAKSAWRKTTKKIVTQHPLSTKEITEVVLATWRDIFASTIGARRYKLGVHIKPKPQIMGDYLHELIPLEFQDRYPGKWRREQHKDEKDMVCIYNQLFSVEIKTSSSPKNIFGNRSYGQPHKVGESLGRKGKSGYYLAINFEKFDKEGSRLPEIRMIRFGWLDHSDWIPQKSPTGQQARLEPYSDANKLLLLHKKVNK